MSEQITQAPLILTFKSHGFNRCDGSITNYPAQAYVSNVSSFSVILESGGNFKIWVLSEVDL